MADARRSLDEEEQEDVPQIEWTSHQDVPSLFLMHKHQQHQHQPIPSFEIFFMRNRNTHLLPACLISRSSNWLFHHFLYAISITYIVLTHSLTHSAVCHYRHHYRPFQLNIFPPPIPSSRYHQPVFLQSRESLYSLTLSCLAGLNLPLVYLSVFNHIFVGLCHSVDSIVKNTHDIHDICTFLDSLRNVHHSHGLNSTQAFESSVTAETKGSWKYWKL